LRLFMLTFENSESIDKIYNIKTIAFQVVKIEAIRRNSNKIAECKNCQGYNHVRSGCHRRTRCVKCAREYLSESCSKPKDFKPICADCGEAHTANYRGCFIARELQQRRNQITNGRKKINIKT
ncbi:Nucleic-acid-binding protein from transposon X-element, partial [Harpegnathos saltator]